MESSRGGQDRIHLDISVLECRLRQPAREKEAIYCRNRQGDSAGEAPRWAGGASGTPVARAGQGVPAAGGSAGWPAGSPHVGAVTSHQKSEQKAPFVFVSQAGLFQVMERRAGIPYS